MRKTVPENETFSSLDKNNDPALRLCFVNLLSCRALEDDSVGSVGSWLIVIVLFAMPCG